MTGPPDAAPPPGGGGGGQSYPGREALDASVADRCATVAPAIIADAEAFAEDLAVWCGGRARALRFVEAVAIVLRGRL
jgi:hypothetical protein